MKSANRRGRLTRQLFGGCGVAPAWVVGQFDVAAALRRPLASNLESRISNLELSKGLVTREQVQAALEFVAHSLNKTSTKPLH
jgi:hypothetical protein